MLVYRPYPHLKPCILGQRCMVEGTPHEVRLHGSNGSPSSSGMNPKAASPSAVYCPPVNVVHSSSSGAGYRHTGEDIHSGRAPARHGQAPPPPAASPVRTELGWGGQLLVGELGPTFLLTRGGSDQSTEGVAAPLCLQQLGITSMLDLADAFSDEEEVRSAIGAADQTAQQLASAAGRKVEARTCHRQTPSCMPVHCYCACNVCAATAG